MTREELQQLLLEPSPAGAKIFRQHGDVLKYLVIWEDYVRHVGTNLERGIHSPMGRARLAIMDSYGIAKQTFYTIRDVLRIYCPDDPSLQDGWFRTY